MGFVVRLYQGSNRINLGTMIAANKANAKIAKIAKIAEIVTRNHKSALVRGKCFDDGDVGDHARSRRSFEAVSPSTGSPSNAFSSSSRLASSICVSDT